MGTPTLIRARDPTEKDRGQGCRTGSYVSLDSVAMTHELESYGLILLFVVVLLEGCGIPLPGETALITAAVLAGSGRFNIVEVIA